ncbi:TPA: hypothetical protein HA317_00300 [Candidatus Woesearchaeota archaeon]|nr:hypothetical protein [Candidatus Woesearchaeota archaeon]
MDAILQAREKLLAVDCLKVLKENLTFKELSEEVDMPPGVLNRYINGYVLPKNSRAKSIIEAFIKERMSRILTEESCCERSKVVITSTILSQPFLLELISFRVNEFFCDEKPTKVLTIEVDGIPLAVKVADFLGARSIYAKRKQEASLHGHYTSNNDHSHRSVATPLYLPKELLKRNDSVLIVDDVVRGGTAMQLLVSICNQVRCRICGMFSIFMTKRAYEMFSRDFKISYLVQIGDA